MPNFDFINAKNHKSDCKSFEKDFDLATFATENTENSGLKESFTGRIDSLQLKRGLKTQVFAFKMDESCFI